MQRPRPETLDALDAAVWEQLQQATIDRSHAWRTPVLATVRGESADARTVILREVDTARRRLLIYSDQRAGKVAQLLHKPHGTMVMWSPALGWQLRCRVRLTLEMSGLSARSIWASLRLTPAAQDYLAPVAPGTPLGATHSPGPTSTSAAPAAHDYFAVIEAAVEALDWLELHPDGHRRAIIDPLGARWVQP